MGLRAIATLAAMVGMSGSALAGAFEDAKAAYERGDDQAALALLQPLATAGDAGAQFWVGAMYDLGRGVAKDYDAAARWYRKAAEQGNPMAQHNLATMYEQRQGLSHDYSLSAAVAWYRRAADQGYAPAQGNLGAMYAEGRGIGRDYVQAYKWFTLAGIEANRSFVLGRMTPEQVVEGDRLIAEWKAKPEK